MNQMATNDVGAPGWKNFEALNKGRESGFMSGATLQREVGGHGLALPCWTILPLRYHAPPQYNFTKIQVYKKEDSINGDYTIQDEYGTTWEVDKENLQHHKDVMSFVEKNISEALAEKCANLCYFQAVTVLDSALSMLWPCHNHTPLELYIRIHRGHALLRAALLQCPAVHRQETSRLIEDSFNTFASCVTTLGTERALLHPFNTSLIFSGLLGLAWISYFRGNMDDAEKYISEAQTVRLDLSHCRSDRDLDSIFFQRAFHKAKGSLKEIEECQRQFGYRLSDYEEDCIHVALLDREIELMKGKFYSSMGISAQLFFDAHFDYTKKVVIEFMDQFHAGTFGDVWFTLGACRQARVAYECAYTSKSLLLQAAALVGLGNVHMRLVKAASVRKKSADQAEKKSEEPDKIYGEAEKRYQEALKIYEELGYKEGQTIVYCDLGNLYHKRKQYEDALKWYTEALKFNVKSYRGAAALDLHSKIAQLHIDQGTWDLAWASLQRAEEIAKDSGQLAVASVEYLQGSYFLRRAISEEGVKDQYKKEMLEAKRHLAVAAQHFAQMQAGLRTYHPLWLSLFEQQKETYELLLWCIACQQNQDSAVEGIVWSERSRSRLLMYENWDRFLESVRSNLPASAAETLQKVALESFDSDSFKDSWKYLQVLLSSLHPTEATLVEYVLCADLGILIFVLKVPKGKPQMVKVSFKEQGLDREKLAALVTSTLTQLRDPHQNEEAKHNLAILFQVLIKPVENYLKNSKHLIIIPHEVLFKVPFHALIDGKKKYLIERHPMSCAESIRSLLRCSILWQKQVQVPASSRDNQMMMLAVGINIHEHFQNLNHAEVEACEVAEILLASKTSAACVLLGSQATKDVVCQHFRKADIVHLATHGVITLKYEEGAILFAMPAASGIGENSGAIVDFEPAYTDEEPSEGGLVTRSTAEVKESMRWISKPLEDKMVLSADEISKMNLRASLVVLSACQTASGVILGEGVAGLGRALLQSGVPCTVLSLWPVSDTATSKLMKEFYEPLARGQSVANAMQKAMVSMIAARGKYTGASSYRVGQWAAFLPFGLHAVQITKTSLVQPVPHPSPKDVLMRTLLLLPAFALIWATSQNRPPNRK